jgi:NAD(P)H-nitrite reductase large subunit
MLDAEAAGLVAKRLEENGIELLFGQDVIEIIGEGDIKAVKLDSGKAIGCSLIVVGKGVQPNIDLVKDAEVKLNEGIIANNLLQASTPNIYTAGDVCESFDMTLDTYSINALWPVAVEQGRIAGANMSGDNINYAGSLGMNSIEFFGLPVISLGIYKTPETGGYEEIKYSDIKANRYATNNIYKKLILKNNIIVGAVLAGDVRNSGIFLRLIRGKIDISSVKDRLLQENFGYPEVMELIKEKEQVYLNAD